MTAYGERAIARYPKHPPAASQPYADGDSLDSGTAFLVDTAVTQLGLASPRLLVETIGPGGVAGYQNPGETWGALADASAPPTLASFGVDAQQIPWDRRTAARFGPRPLIADYDSTTGAVTCRQIRMRVAATIDGAVTTHVALFALTTSASAADLVAGRYLAFATASFAGTGAQVATTTLTLTDALPRTLYEPFHSGDTADALIIPGWLWFGWLLLGATTTSTIDALSAWEIR